MATTDELRDLFYNYLTLEERDAAHNWMNHDGGRWLSYYKLAAQAALRTEVKRLRQGLEMIRDRETLEPSEYIAAYGLPVGSPGDLARALLQDNEPGG